MKFIILISAFCLLSCITKAQWSTVSPYTYLTTTTNRVGIGTTSPSIGKLQIGSPGSTDSNKIVILGPYNFEKAKLGQYPNGAAGLEFINHTDYVNAYGIRLYANVDQARGLQFQYAPTASAEANLSYITGMFMRADNGNIGIGTTSPNAKLNVDPQGAGSILIGNPIQNAQNYTSLSLGISAQTGGYTYIQGVSSAGLSYGNMSLNPSGGNVGIGTTAPQSLLAVKGTITAQKVVVIQTGWSDYVFDSSYRLRSLPSVNNFIQANKHLPDVQSAADVKKDGIDIGDNQAVLLKKIEELTLYMIDQDKQLSNQKEQLMDQNKKIEALQQQVAAIKKKQR